MALVVKKPVIQSADALDADMRGLLVTLWRRRMMITAFLLIGLSLASLALLFIRPHYAARAMLMVNIPAAAVPQGIDPSAGQPRRYDASLILGEVEVLRSRSMARGVIERLGLMNDPEFNRKLKGAASRGEFKNLAVYGAELSRLPPEARDAQAADVVTRFLSRLTVRPVAGSYAIQLEFKSLHPGKAALIANALADAYIEQSLAQSFAATQKLAGWMEKRLAALRAEAQARDMAVQRYKAEHNIMQGTTTLISAAQVSELSSQLVLARAAQAEAQARVMEAESLAKTPARMDSAAAVLDSTVIQKLKLEQARIESDLSELSNRYGPKHPEILKLKSELAETKNAIRGEITTISHSVESELHYADARVAALEAGLSASGGQQHQDDEIMVGLRALEMEAESTRLVLDKFLESAKRGMSVEELQEPAAKIISHAVVSRVPATPNKMLVLSLSCVMALFAGVAAALLLEKLDNSFRSGEQVETALGVPCLGLIPAAGKIKPPYLGRYPLAKPASPLAESVRTLRMVLNLRAGPEKPKVITVTSSFPGEGKTTLSLWLARLSALSGEKVIVIDADLRRPSIHKAAGQVNDAALSEYLSGGADLKKIIRKDSDSPAHIIFGSSVPHNALDLVGSKRMKELVAQLRIEYDLVILDSPASLAVSDARLLATLSDAVLYAVKWDRTPREAVAGGLKHFTDMGYGGALGVVLTAVDVKRHAAYGYGDTMHYYGRYAGMYAG